jgi:transposase
MAQAKRVLSTPRRTASKILPVGVRQAIEAVGAHLRYLPQYSPDFNPIEQGFSKVKSKLRKAAERTIKGLCRNRLDCTLLQYPGMCKFLRACGVWLNVSGICSR